MWLMFVTLELIVPRKIQWIHLYFRFHCDFYMQTVITIYGLPAKFIYCHWTCEPSIHSSHVGINQYYPAYGIKKKLAFFCGKRKWENDENTATVSYINLFYWLIEKMYVILLVPFFSIFIEEKTYFVDLSWAHTNFGLVDFFNEYVQYIAVVLAFLFIQYYLLLIY